jgi:hypothetical protein
MCNGVNLVQTLANKGLQSLLAPLHHWGHRMCVLALFTLRRRAHCHTIEGMECVCEHYSRCVVARTAAPLGA